MNGYITLGELIRWLEKQDQDLTVKDGFSWGHHYRKRELAFTPIPETQICHMLKWAQSVIDKSVSSYEEGEYIITEFTPVSIAEHGCLGEYITPTTFKYWLLTGHK
jgi:hypothetical protein